jgi:hypothetical protein
MECDSIHSLIEKKSKNIPIYTPSDWFTVMRQARQNPSPLSVIILRRGDFLNFKAVASSLFRGIQKDESGEKVNWLKVRWLEYNTDLALTVKFKTDLNADSRFHSFTLRHQLADH